MPKSITIISDHRESRSGIPQLLTALDVNNESKTLNTGDYLINDQILVERKKKDDFTLSIIQGRLFSQCARMKKADYHSILLIEGNPYTTAHKIDRNAIKGAMLSVSVSWQIPIIFSSNQQDTAHTLLQIANQHVYDRFSTIRNGYKPKSQKKKAEFLLQGLPSVGPKIASNLIKHFGSVEKVIVSKESELMKVEGIGKNKALEIRRLLEFEYGE